MKTRKIMTATQVAEYIISKNNPEAAKDASVSLIFWDGEHVSTKAGDLLWNRTLHCFGNVGGQSMRPDVSSILIEKMPETSPHVRGRFIFCTYEVAMEIDAFLKEFNTGVMDPPSEDLLSRIKTKINACLEKKNQLQREVDAFASFADQLIQELSAKSQGKEV